MAEQTAKIKLTASSKKKYEAELNELKTVRRKEVAENLQSARAQGDLSENSEYDEAINDQAKLEARIKELEGLLRNVEVVDESAFDNGKVHLYSRVKVYDHDFGEEVVYKIVSSNEADPLSGAISDESPVGNALLDKSEGETVIVETPDGEIRLDILEITM